VPRFCVSDAAESAQLGVETRGCNGVIIRIPGNLAMICQLTFMCTPPPVGPDIHANAAGYRVIARSIADRLF
jgi:lysophospholipase L1-like esterase